MENNTDYECYVIGCKYAGEIALSEQRFRPLQEAWLRLADGPSRRTNQEGVPAFVLEQLAALVAEGYQIAAGSREDGEEPGTAACGVREPRVPTEPVLTGSAARSLPHADAPDLSFWRT